LQEWSRCIQERVLASDLFCHARAVALYHSFDEEVGTQFLFDHCLATGKKVAFPQISDPKGPLHFFWVNHPSQLIPSKFGIAVPDETQGQAKLEEMDLMILPGLAFDREGGRLGRGKGHYDRTLKGFLGQRLGLAYSFQILDELPREAWDEKVNWLASEDEWIQASSSH